eukprot:TRINITY_DN4164_c0_g1_i1.p1 TRINITY_DN4164_c0_g1~~TRINITY_DN4164_c0_g1_i1.p1  ORF type:complete len:1108 (-),score=148.62 TRINITY_DN4164_c0_g1_i1:35-3028(-)
MLFHFHHETETQSSLPHSTVAAINSLDFGALHHINARVDSILQLVQPSLESEKHRAGVLEFIEGLIRDALAADDTAEVMPYGSLPLKTYLPDGDVDLEVFVSGRTATTWLSDVKATLERVAANPVGRYKLHNINFINAEIKILKCYADNVAVDISANQIGGLRTLRLLEEVDRIVGKNHLFKKSILLVKTWCYYESRILGSHHGLMSTYALETLILYLFNTHGHVIQTPFQVLWMFLSIFGSFDFDRLGISIRGPFLLSSLPEICYIHPEPTLGFLLSEDFLHDCATRDQNADEKQRVGTPFVQKHINVMDPLRDDNNIGRSINKGNSFRIRTALLLGASLMAHHLSMLVEVKNPNPEPEQQPVGGPAPAALLARPGGVDTELESPSVYTTAAETFPHHIPAAFTGVTVDETVGVPLPTGFHSYHHIESSRPESPASGSGGESTGSFRSATSTPYVEYGGQNAASFPPASHYQDAVFALKVVDAQFKQVLRRHGSGLRPDIAGAPLGQAAYRVPRRYPEPDGVKPAAPALASQPDSFDMLGGAGQHKPQTRPDRGFSDPGDPFSLMRHVPDVLSGDLATLLHNLKMAAQLLIASQEPPQVPIFPIPHLRQAQSAAFPRLHNFIEPFFLPPPAQPPAAPRSSSVGRQMSHQQQQQGMYAPEAIPEPVSVPPAGVRVPIPYATMPGLVGAPPGTGSAPNSLPPPPPPIVAPNFQSAIQPRRYHFMPQGHQSAPATAVTVDVTPQPYFQTSHHNAAVPAQATLPPAGPGSSLAAPVGVVPQNFPPPPEPTGNVLESPSSIVRQMVPPPPGYLLVPVSPVESPPQTLKPRMIIESPRSQLASLAPEAPHSTPVSSLAPASSPTSVLAPPPTLTPASTPTPVPPTPAPAPAIPAPPVSGAREHGAPSHPHHHRDTHFQRRWNHSDREMKPRRGTSQPSHNHQSYRNGGNILPAPTSATPLPTGPASATASATTTQSTTYRPAVRQMGRYGIAHPKRNPPENS